MNNSLRQSIRAWDLTALVLTLGTMACSIVGAFLLDAFIQRPDGGGSVTTLIPGVAYASATIMKVCLASGLVSIVAAIVSRVSDRVRGSETASLDNQEEPGSESKTLKPAVPLLSITSVALTALTPLFAALAVLIAQTLVDKPQGISLSYFPQVARTSVLVMLAQISIGAIAALTSLVRRERLVMLSVLGLLTNFVLIGLFWYFEFYALGFDQDTWAPR